jgi:hypothetical protein
MYMKTATIGVMIIGKETQSYDNSRVNYQVENTIFRQASG